jgi:anthranilate 1,2-dioxygenase small subunit/terephthalate 1,2-dioxygenase oxygenase component beta subunit
LQRAGEGSARAAGRATMNIDLQLKVQDLNARYAEAIDDDRLETWPDFFVDTCHYLVTTAENVAQGFPIGLMFATSRAMLRDRIKALREANVYEAQRYRHILGTPIIEEDGANTVQARTGFMVARIMHTGETILFATGCYRDRIVIDQTGQARFVEKVAILDSRQIDTLLAIPV